MRKAYELDCKQKCLQAGHPSLRRDSSLFSCCPNFCSYAELVEVALMRTLSVLATGTCRFTIVTVAIERLSIAFTANSKREFVPHGQVFHLLNLLLLFIITT